MMSFEFEHRKLEYLIHNWLDEKKKKDFILSKYDVRNVFKTKISSTFLKVHSYLKVVSFFKVFSTDWTIFKPNTFLSPKIDQLTEQGNRGYMRRIHVTRQFFEAIGPHDHFFVKDMV